MNNPLAISLALFLGLMVTVIPPSAQAHDKYAGHIRATEALPPEDEQKGFHLPPGFEIQLVAAEPDLQKPLNLAFDSKGRLWVSGSTEYPYAAPLDRPGRDTIKILEDTNGDGRADKINTFADGLNIPIGLYPQRESIDHSPVHAAATGGRKAVCASRLAEELGCQLQVT